ncbi:MAG: hypothetical protein HN952_03485 [Candidatus Cloacimonetes bacterium]|jgi:hypothetical protein|nr:hypothetical protein [Candidatus Cloacimonadota bacterium]MBT6993999.1 hypothetical protein [Candidatus Cloacimonadota bacterium]MBT7470323.1 hypothetical protein [Candidatus Cloacimonadota bacterium]
MNLFKVTVLTIFIGLAITLSGVDLTEKIEKYAGANATELLELLETQTGKKLYYLNFILENCSANDLAVLKADYLLQNVELAMQTSQFSYTEDYDDDIFKHFVLPHRVSQEPLEDWRAKFMEELKSLVENETDIEAAAILVNLWANEQMTFKQTHGRDQAPITTVKRGYGRCEEMMIIYIAAARAVGIPARPASAPYWNFTNNNHAWVEIWTPAGWQYLGEPNNRLNDVWFTNTTKRSTLIIAEAFGDYESRNTIKQENNVTYISSIEYYTDYEDCQITVFDAENNPVEDARITLYATSWGGLFPLFNLTSDATGNAEIQLGKGSVYVTAFKDGKFAHSLFNMMESSNLTLVLDDDKTIDEQFDFVFPIPQSSIKSDEKKEVLGEKFYLMRENVNLKRKNRLNELKIGYKFAKYYDEVFSQEDDDFFGNREKFIEKCDEIAENSNQFLTVLEKEKHTDIIVKMIDSWDIKELCEIPDSNAIFEVTNIYKIAQNRFDIPDSIFTENLIGFTWRSGTPPQNGWQKEFYQKIEKLAGKTPAKTVKNVLKWVDKQIEIDDNFVWTYFSGSLNPNDILNLKHIPEFYRTKVVNCALKLLGVPIRWKGRLEYFDGAKFVAVENSNEKEEADEKETSLQIAIFVDGKQVKAEAWENFLIADLNEEGTISYTYFDGENDSLTFNAVYRPKADKNIYLEAFMRNGNGDANVVLKSLENLDEITVNLETPKEYLDNSADWDLATLQKLEKIIDSQKTILFVRGEVANEPEARMLKQIAEKSDKFKETEIIIYSENRNNDDIADLTDKFILKTGEKLLDENNDYPVIFLFDETKNLIFSSNGYNMGIVELLLKK